MIYVDQLAKRGWRMWGREISSCHMITDTLELAPLHTMAVRIGLKRAWFQAGKRPHYDLTPTRREIAVRCGAIEVTSRELIEVLRERDRRRALPADA